MKMSYTLALVGTLVAASAGTAMAGMSSSYVDTRQQAEQLQAETIGQRLANGTLTEPQVEQLVQFTGLTTDEAKKYTIPEVTGMRWTNN